MHQKFGTDRASKKGEFGKVLGTNLSEESEEQIEGRERDKK